MLSHTSKDVLERFQLLYESLLAYDGFGEMRIEMKILKRGQKEIILHCGKQYRFVVDYRPREAAPYRAERRTQSVAIDFPERRRATKKLAQVSLPSVGSRGIE